MLFPVTYEIVTQKSVEHGAAEERGFITEGAPLRQALANLYETRTSRVEGVVCVEHDGRWSTVQNGMEFSSGAYESRALHRPENITNHSWARVQRLISD